MKKTLVTCLVVVALFAIATSASAITCTRDQRPAATLLLPWFQATFNADGTILNTGASALDTLVTIGNASSSPMIAHVSVWSERTELVLDFNIALTGFDIQSWSMASVLRGFLPSTPVNTSHVVAVKDANQVTLTGDVCQRNPAAFTNSFGGACPAPDVPCQNPGGGVGAGGYLRVRPGAPATALDNTLATVVYPAGPFPTAFLFQVIDSLDVTSDSNICGGGVNTIITNPIHGYVTIDHANYCNLSNPSDPAYYTNDAMGMENNLWGDYIYVNGAGLGTMGFPLVAIEADPSLFDPTGAPTSINSTCNLPAGGGPLIPGTLDCIGRRTFYRRYVTTPDVAFCNPANVFPPADTWNCGFGDQREPLGLKYAARWFDSAPAVTSNFNVWRASSVPSAVLGGRQDLLGRPIGACNISEPTVTLTFYDEDENTVTSGVCPSPCTQTPFNFPLETQRTSITVFPHPVWPAGWVAMSFFNGTGPVFGDLDQAYVTYDFQGGGIFLSAGIEAAQLDPSACQPLQVVVICPIATPLCVVPSFPVIPVIVGTGP